jgi:CheY-like chemotaxis protein
MKELLDILVIEDNEGDIFLINECLNEESNVRKITTLKNGAAAINFLSDITMSDKKLIPNIILLDINLPLKSGHEVLEFLNKNSRLSEIPVIVFTSSSSLLDINKAYNQNASCYITKPLELKEYKSIIHHAIHFGSYVFTSCNSNILNH